MRIDGESRKLIYVSQTHSISCFHHCFSFSHLFFFSLHSMLLVVAFAASEFFFCVWNRSTMSKDRDVLYCLQFFSIWWWYYKMSSILLLNNTINVNTDDITCEKYIRFSYPNKLFYFYYNFFPFFLMLLFLYCMFPELIHFKVEDWSEFICAHRYRKQGHKHIYIQNNQVYFLHSNARVCDNEITWLVFRLAKRWWRR